MKSSDKKLNLKKEVLAVLGVKAGVKAGMPKGNNPGWSLAGPSGCVPQGCGGYGING